MITVHVQIGALMQYCIAAIGFTRSQLCFRTRAGEEALRVHYEDLPRQVRVAGLLGRQLQRVQEGSGAPRGQVCRGIHCPGQILSHPAAPLRCFATPNDMQSGVTNSLSTYHRCCTIQIVDGTLNLACQKVEDKPTRMIQDNTEVTPT